MGSSPRLPNHAFDDAQLLLKFRVPSFDLNQIARLPGGAEIGSHSFYRQHVLLERRSLIDRNIRQARSGHREVANEKRFPSYLIQSTCGDGLTDLCLVGVNTAEKLVNRACAIHDGRTCRRRFRTRGLLTSWDIAGPPDLFRVLSLARTARCGHECHQGCQNQESASDHLFVPMVILSTSPSG